MDKDFFSLNFGGIPLIGDIVPRGNQPHVLCIHGAGPADRKRFEKLRELFTERGIATCAFDFIGHGDTGGNLSLSSLESRVKQSLAIINEGKVAQPLSIIASSMSGYVAIKLTELCKVENLIFFAPAIYNTKAYSISFGPKFTEIIRKTHSWRDSDAWDILREYSGNLLLFAAEKDQVIPSEVIQKIYESAKQSRFKEVITIRGATHPLGKWLNEHPLQLDNVFKKIQQVIQ